MAAGINIAVSDISFEVADAFLDTRQRIAEAATGAIKLAEGALKNGVRQNIGAAGFSSKWQNAWRTRTYPPSGVSIDGAVFGWHKIGYSPIFEDGGTIRAKKGMLWIPLPTVPKQGRTKATPRGLATSGVKLFSINRPGKKPLLAASVKGEGPPGKSLSVSKLRGRGRGEARAVPLFVGVPSVNIRKRFNVAGVGASVSAKLGDFYFASLRTD